MFLLCIIKSCYDVYYLMIFGCNPESTSFNKSKQHKLMICTEIQCSRVVDIGQSKKTYQYYIYWLLGPFFIRYLQIPPARTPQYPRLQLGYQLLVIGLHRNHQPIVDHYVFVIPWYLYLSWMIYHLLGNQIQ